MGGSCTGGMSAGIVATGRPFFRLTPALPAAYTTADLMELPSEYEPFAVVVNEASCCGCPLAASDHIAPVNPDFIFPCRGVL
jgi:hypothetical protein